MKKIALTNQLHTVEITKLCIGETGFVNDQKREFVHRCADAYLARGGNCFDTARVYGGGRSEEFLGQYLKTKHRADIIISTKCAHPDIGNPLRPSRLSPQELTSDLETSLRTLGTDYVDIFYLHRDDIKIPVENIMPTLHGFVQSGKVRVLGASNWTAGRIQEANTFAKQNICTPFSVSQIQWSLAKTTAAQSGDLTHVIMDDVEYSWYTDEKLPVMPWTATAKGFLSHAAAGDTLKPNTAHMFGWLAENYRRAKRAQEIADKLGVSVCAVALAYLMCDPVPTSVITAFSNETQFEETMQSLEVTLTQEMRSYLLG